MHYRPHIIAHHQLGIKRIKHAVLMAKCYYNDTYNSETLGVYRVSNMKRLKLIHN